MACEAAFRLARSYRMFKLYTVFLAQATTNGSLRSCPVLMRKQAVKRNKKNHIKRNWSKMCSAGWEAKKKCWPTQSTLTCKAQTERYCLTGSAALEDVTAIMLFFLCSSPNSSMPSEKKGFLSLFFTFLPNFFLSWSKHIHQPNERTEAAGYKNVEIYK